VPFSLQLLAEAGSNFAGFTGHPKRMKLAMAARR